MTAARAPSRSTTTAPPIQPLTTRAIDVLYEPNHDRWLVGLNAPGIDEVDPVTLEVTRFADSGGPIPIARLYRLNDEVLGTRAVDFAGDPNRVVVASALDAAPAASRVVDLTAIDGVGSSPQVWARSFVQINDHQLAYSDAFRGAIARLDASFADWALDYYTTPAPGPWSMPDMVGGDGVLVVAVTGLDGRTTIVAFAADEDAPWTDGFVSRLGTWSFVGGLSTLLWDASNRAIFATTAANGALGSYTGLMRIDLDDPEATPRWQPYETDWPRRAGAIASRPVLIGDLVVVVHLDIYDEVRATFFDRVTLRRVGYLHNATYTPLPFDSVGVAPLPSAYRDGAIYVGGGYALERDFVIDVSARLP